MIKHINTVGIYVEDQDRAVRFYVEKLGFIIHTNRPMGPARWIEVGPAERAELPRAVSSCHDAELSATVWQ